MKKNLIIAVLCSVLFFVAGYFAGNFFPLHNDRDSDESSTDETSPENEQNTENGSEIIPDGKGILNVEVVSSDGTQMVGIEVDVGYAPGAPPPWGVAEADPNGIVRYELDPGEYVIFFNENRFPSGYRAPDAQRVTVEEGRITDVKITLQAI